MPCYTRPGGTRGWPPASPRPRCWRAWAGLWCPSAPRGPRWPPPCGGARWTPPPPCFRPVRGTRGLVASCAAWRRSAAQSARRPCVACPAARRRLGRLCRRGCCEARRPARRQERAPRSPSGTGRSQAVPGPTGRGGAGSGSQRPMRSVGWARACTRSCSGWSRIL